MPKLFADNLFPDGLISNGGGSSGVTSVTGSGTILVNGVTGTAQTGDVTLSLSASPTTTIIGTLDQILANGQAGVAQSGAVTLTLAHSLTSLTGTSRNITINGGNPTNFYGNATLNAFRNFDTHTYYVALNGDDTLGNGTSIDPYATAGKASFQALINANDTNHMCIKIGGGYFPSGGQPFYITPYTDIIGSGSNTVLDFNAGIGTSGMFAFYTNALVNIKDVTITSQFTYQTSGSGSAIINFYNVNFKNAPIQLYGRGGTSDILNFYQCDFDSENPLYIGNCKVNFYNCRINQPISTSDVNGTETSIILQGCDYYSINFNDSNPKNLQIENSIPIDGAYVYIPNGTNSYGVMDEFSYSNSNFSWDQFTIQPRFVRPFLVTGYVNSTQSAVTGESQIVTIPYDLILTDATNNWDYGDYGYTARCDGLYSAEVSLSLTNIQPPNHDYIRLFIETFDANNPSNPKIVELLKIASGTCTQAGNFNGNYCGKVFLTKGEKLYIKLQVVGVKTCVDIDGGINNFQQLNRILIYLDGTYY